jgi:hypothetical protein
MVEGRVARNSKPRRDRGYVPLALLEREAVSVPVLADIGVVTVSHGKVQEQVPHQSSRSTRERYVPRMMLLATRICKFKHLSVLP